MFILQGSWQKKAAVTHFNEKKNTWCVVIVLIVTEHIKTCMLGITTSVCCIHLCNIHMCKIKTHACVQAVCNSLEGPAHTRGF